jgi:hypothetical protein
MRRMAIVLVVMAAAVPGSASAATRVELGHVSAQRQAPAYRYLSLLGDPAGADVTITAGERAIVVRVAHGTVTATGRCTAVDERTARCGMRTSFPLHVDVLFGSGDDSLTAEGSLEHLRGPWYEFNVSGGSGDDVVLGSESPGTGVSFFGGQGNDALHGGPGGEYMEDGVGHDSFHGGGGNDAYGFRYDERLDPGVIDGGDGRDRILYSNMASFGHVKPVVDLGAGTDSLDNEISAVEDAYDAVAASGTDEANVLAVGAPDGWAIGRGGADVLYGSHGTLLDGGEGDDFLRGGGDARCGSGVDVVARPSTVRADCEFVGTYDRETIVPRQPVSVAGEVARFEVPCDPRPGRRLCRFRASLGAGRVTAWAQRGQIARFDVPLPDAGPLLKVSVACDTGRTRRRLHWEWRLEYATDR